MTWVISLGGLLIIAAVLGILVFIGREALPLGRSGKSRPQASLQTAPSGGLLADESGKVIALLRPESGVECIALSSGAPLTTLEDGPARPWKQVTEPSARGEFAVLDREDKLFFGRLSWDKPAGDPDPAHWTPSVEWHEGAAVAGMSLMAVRTVLPSGMATEPSYRILASTKEGLTWAELNEGKLSWNPLNLPELQDATQALWSADGNRLWVGTRSGNLHFVNMEGDPSLQGTLAFGQSISALGFVLGQSSLLVGGEQGKLAACQAIKKEDGFLLQWFHDFDKLDGPVQGFKASLRDKRFLAWTPSQVVVDHLTTEERLFKGIAADTRHAALSPRGEFIYASNGKGELRSWSLDAPHPEISAKVLWGKVHYEGYEKPEQVWQSSGGTDDFEPKLSLMPLVFGTLKGTLFAMLFALPLALFGALYTSQFAHPKLKNIIKPAVEIMAALPSVVLGFLAGLMLAPLLEKSAVHVVLLPFFTLLAVCIIAPLWSRMPKSFRLGWGQGREVLWLIPAILIGLGLCLGLAPSFERIFLGGDFRAWLLAKHSITYDQRNAIVVGFAMGFAVIPIIFSVSEDALSSVPKAMTSASLACGASPWQTAWRVVVPTASPGIFSAVMVGLGRAIGETMIVLMATGNTPLMDWSPFNGMRTLAANIAVEAPEAPLHGTLYRVLFLTALLLFALTFILNTGAEVIRQHLRKRYETF